MSKHRQTVEIEQQEKIKKRIISVYITGMGFSLLMYGSFIEGVKRGRVVSILKSELPTPMQTRELENTLGVKTDIGGICKGKLLITITFTL